MKKVFYLLFIPLFFFACKSKEEPKPELEINRISEHLQLGNPSEAGDISRDNYLMIKEEYALSYNNAKGHANWVAWNLRWDWLGTTPRQDNFRADPELPEGFKVVPPTDYSNSGFDRGHLCPSADRTNTITANSSTFLMTNMIPQAPNNNQQTWANLEDYVRDLMIDRQMEAHIYAGTYGTGGTGSNGSANSLQNGKINVPSNVWKVIVLLPIGWEDEKRVFPTTRVIAVDMPNTQTINSNWRNYRVSVRTLEQRTGYNFLSRVPQSIQDQIETIVDTL